MSQPSPLEAITTGKTRSTGEGTGWTLLRYGWPALLLFAAFAAGFYAMVAGASEALSLSREALANGRWWTLLSHIFVNAGMGGGILIFALFAAGLTATATPNPGWMGGWRMPAVFIGAGLAGALAQLLADPAVTLVGPWPAALGLAGYYLASQRWASLFAGPLPKHSAEEEAQAEAGSQAMSWVNGWLFLLLLGPMAAWIPSFLPGEGATRIAIGVAIIAGGGAVIYAIVRLGGQPGRKIARLAVLAMSALGLLAGVYVFGGKLLEHLDAVLTLPWASYAAGLIGGVAAGLLERRATRSH